MQQITKAQRQALKNVYDRDRSVAKSYLAFRRSARYSKLQGCLMVYWKCLWLGIENDGYTHS